MNAFELLKNDHRKVSQLMQEIEPLGKDQADRRRQLFTALKQELEVHAHIEESIFYPLLEREAQTKEIAAAAVHEHQQVKDLLARLEQTPANGDDWQSLLLELRQNVEHHVGEEENEMFPQALELLGEQQLDNLGTQMRQEKENRMRQMRTATAG